MITFNLLTTLPLMFAPLNQSIIKRGVEKGLLKINIVNIRDYANNKNQNTDDAPYGGGNGMVMTIQPIFSAIESIKDKGHVIYMSPKGKTLTQNRAIELSNLDSITILCGHYEGVDQRVLDSAIDEEISIGDYVLTGGEIPAMVLVDSVSRLIPNVLSNDECFINESHYDGLLEYPQFTRPASYNEMDVPKVLISGNHKKIDEYRFKMSLLETHLKRPDMLKKRGLNEEEKIILREALIEREK